MRDNEEIQKKLQKIRRDKENENEQNNPKSIVISEMMTEISSLRKKLNKIESENEKIRRKKKELQVNMRNCIKNNQEMVRADMSSKKMKNSKSKSMFTKCPYH